MTNCAIIWSTCTRKSRAQQALEAKLSLRYAAQDLFRG